MKKFFNFVKTHPLGAPLSVLSAIFIGVGLYNEAYGLYYKIIGLRPEELTFYSALVFIASVMGIIFRQSSIIGDLRKEKEVSEKSSSINPKKKPSLRPANVKAWSGLGEYKLLQAACLWAEIEPILNPASMPSEVRPFYEMLCQAIRNKTIPAYVRQRSGHLSQTRDPKSGVIIKRGSLEFLANQRDERPRFLFPGDKPNPHAWMAK